MKNIILAPVALLITATTFAQLTTEQQNQIFIKGLRKLFPGATPELVMKKSKKVFITEKMAEKDQKKRYIIVLNDGTAREQQLMAGDTVRFYNGKPFYSFYDNALIGNVVNENKKKTKTEKPPRQGPSVLEQVLVGVGRAASSPNGQMLINQLVWKISQR
jgi:hypothetical protein